MEDGVTEAERFIMQHKEEENHHEENEVKEEERDSATVGLLSHMVSNNEENQKEKGDRIFDNLIFHLVSPLSPKAGDHDDKQNKGEEEEEEEEVVKFDGENDDKEGGGGIIDNIVSHFPKSLPDDAVPTTDEASILIHSIVHD